MMTGDAVSFVTHVALLDRFLSNRRAIVDSIERSLLNVRDKDLSRSRNRAQFSRLLNSCFFGLPGLPRDMAQASGALAARHLADGFEPVQLDAFVNELDPLELIVRGYEYWDATRWPGSAGRATFAQTIFVVFLLRQLEQLSLRIWDDGDRYGEERLEEVQALLNSLNEAPAPSPFVRDARWLIQTGLGPFTRHLGPYFTVADHIAGSFTDPVRLGLHSAGARLAGGHLRSQLRYRMWQTHLPIDDPENLSVTRNSNALDNALLVRDLVALMHAYATAAHDDAGGRLALADAILQGLSVDPDLFVARLDLLAPYTMIEELFVEASDGRPARHTALGERQESQVEVYTALVGTVAAQLREDADRLSPAHCGYSPLGITYGFCADVMSNMAMDPLLGQPSFGLTLEDVFVTGEHAEDKRARTSGWQRLPRRPGENDHFDHSVEFAEQVFAWLTRTLEARAARPGEANTSARPSSRVFVTAASRVGPDIAGTVPADITAADDYCLDTSPPRAASTGATAWTDAQLLTDRREGRLLASAQVNGAWMGISKILLTRLTAQGLHAILTHIPPPLASLLTFACPDLVVELPARGDSTPADGVEVLYREARSGGD